MMNLVSPISGASGRSMSIVRRARPQEPRPQNSANGRSQTRPQVRYIAHVRRCVRSDQTDVTSGVSRPATVAGLYLEHADWQQDVSRISVLV